MGKIDILKRSSDILRDPRTSGEKMKRAVLRLLATTVAAVVLAYNINSFVNTGGLFPGGISGVTLLVTRVAQKYMEITIPYSFIYLPLNAIPIYIGFRFLGKKFTLWSVYFTVLTSILIDIMPQIAITYDILLISIFGGIINGISICLCLWVGASGGGTDIISIFLSEKKGIDAWNYILAGNIVVLVLAGALFGWDKALYSIVFQFVNTQVIQTLFKKYSKSTLIIITDMPESVYDKISILTHHDATRFEGEGYYHETKKHMIYSVVGREDVSMIVKEIKAIDPKAFINVLTTDQLSGQFYRRPND